MKDKKNEWVAVLTLALGIAILPPIWAVLSGHIGVSVGSVALICAAVYVANGNKKQDAVRITVGFWLGDLWSVFALWIMNTLQFHPDVELYLTLFFLGGAAVILGNILCKWAYLPAWLCGWAIGLTVMGEKGLVGIGSLPLEIGAAMFVGVVYVGVGVDTFQKWLMRRVVSR